MNTIEKPFNLAIDLTDQSPLSEFDRLGIPVLSKESLKTKHKAANDLKQGVAKLAVNPNVFSEIMREIHRTVSAHDNHVVTVVLSAALSTYNKALNLALKAESGAGKTYSTMQTISLLPDEDVKTMNYVSPKVFIHESGVLKNKDGEIIPETSPAKPTKQEYPDELDLAAQLKQYHEEIEKRREELKTAYYEVDVRNKVFVFMEGIDQKLFTILKTTMSHDNAEHGFNDSKYVDDKGHVHTTRLVGAPAMIFNSVDAGEYNNEFATRCLTATPNTSTEKIRAAMKIGAKKAAYPWLYKKDRLERQIIKEYFRKIRDTMQQGRITALCPFDDIDTLFPATLTRDMRDFDHFKELIAPFAMLHLFQRPIVIINNQRYLLPTVQDVLDAKAAFDAIIQTTQSNADNMLLIFYWAYVADKANGTTAEVLTDQYNKDHKKKISSSTIYKRLEQLVKLEWVDARHGEQLTSKGYVDNQKLTYHPLKQCEKSGKLDYPQDLCPEIENKFKLWLKTSVGHGYISTPIIIPRIDGTAYQINIDELANIVLTSQLPAEILQIEAERERSYPTEDLPPQQDRILAEIPKNSALLENTQVLASNDFRLAPNEYHQCEGTTDTGEQCPLRAEHYIKYKDNPNICYFCLGHFKPLLKQSIQDGFKLEA